MTSRCTVGCSTFVRGRTTIAWYGAALPRQGECDNCIHATYLTYIFLFQKGARPKSMTARRSALFISQVFDGTSHPSGIAARGTVTSLSPGNPRILMGSASHSARTTVVRYLPMSPP